MKKIIIAIICAFVAFGAYAENENAATSKEYVDAELAMKQPTAPAQGNNVVMTFDSTATDGIGTKQIYDESTPYASQTDALVTAETANAAVQMAINGEFYCKEYSTIDPTDCWLWGIKEPTPHSASKNLFNIKNAKILYANSSPMRAATKTDSGYLFPRPANPSGFQFIVVEFGDINDFLGQTLTLSAVQSCVTPRYFMGYSDDNGLNRKSLSDSKSITVTPQNGGQTKIVIWLYGTVGTSEWCDEYSNIQVEYGSTATAYEPYQNLYIPQNVQ